MDRSIPQRLNFILASVLVGLHVYTFYFQPYFFPQNENRLALLLLVTALLTPQYWALIHDAGHLALFKNRRLNNLFGRMMSILFGSNFKLLQFGHNLHHTFNRTEIDRTDLFEKGSISPLWAHIVYYAKIFFGLYLGEVLLPFLFLLPRRLIQMIAATLFERRSPRYNRVYLRIRQSLLTPDALRTIRIDTLLLTLHFGTLLFLYHDALYLLGGFFLLRAFMVSFFDNIYHYATPKESDDSYNLFLPALFSRLLLNFNYHQVHHAHPSVPWIHLPGLFRQEDFRFDKGYTSALAAQVKGPIWI